MGLIKWILTLAPALAIAISYNISFEGLQNPSCLRAMRDASQLVSMQNHPPASINGLRYRIASDIPELLRVLRAFGYYDASIATDIETEGNSPLQVHIIIHGGPQYTLSSYEVYQGDCTEPAHIPTCSSFSPEQLGLEIGHPALSTEIVNGEMNLLTELSQCGYPLAYIDKRRVLVDVADKTVHAASCIQEGPLSKFGATTLFGLTGVKARFIDTKIGWKEGDIYNSLLIEKTQERLLKSELFSSVYITHGNELNEQGELPIKIRLSEASHQRISLGASYATVDGFGGTLSWTHRNVGGMGEILTLKAEASELFLVGNLTFKKPDFLTFDQTYRAFGELSREDIRAYLSFIYRFANFIDKKIDPKRMFSAGLKIEHLNISSSANNGTYLLLGVPLFFRYDNANQFLDPTNGYSIVYSATPYQSLFYSNQHFIKQRLTGQLYLPLDHANRWVLALRGQFGSIAGTKQKYVPLTKLFLGGSELDLRGYRYKTVSPIGAHHKPYGGRSAIFTTAELRWKVTKTIGIVPFADFGTVAFSQLPKFDMKWFKSVGIGVRYFAFLGPLRFDLAFPLDKRDGIDPNFQFYASIGQTF